MTPYSLAKQSTLPSCQAYAATLQGDVVEFYPKAVNDGSFETEVIMTGSRPPESPQSSESPSPDRNTRTEDFELPRKKKFRVGTMNETDFYKMDVNFHQIVMF